MSINQPATIEARARVRGTALFVLSTRAVLDVVAPQKDRKTVASPRAAKVSLGTRNLSFAMTRMRRQCCHGDAAGGVLGGVQQQKGRGWSRDEVPQYALYVKHAVDFIFPFRTVFLTIAPPPVVYALSSSATHVHANARAGAHTYTRACARTSTHAHARTAARTHKHCERGVGPY